MMCYWVGANNSTMAIHTDTMNDRLYTNGQHLSPDDERDVLRSVVLLNGLYEVNGIDLDKDWIGAMRDIRYFTIYIHTTVSDCVCHSELCECQYASLQISSFDSLRSPFAVTSFDTSCGVFTHRQQLSSEYRGGLLDMLQSSVITILQQHIQSTAKIATLQSRFKSTVKVLCAIASNLGLSRECR